MQNAVRIHLRTSWQEVFWMAKQIHEVFKENNIQDKNNDINIAASNIFAIGVTH